ncbi:acyl-CoA dehydrogenase family protein [Patulibacter sp. SYSU D01012]|uniref:acyl-CoA dehydrogenase family protein n=1 Tax=Patulibacter sp. SYSU D01012 TaxID=2817381 RepID=UPI001B3087E4|nr:acyl-CoA dehydrogenase family protein [Patulibacter sp. SYSU D01012]
MRFELSEDQQEIQGAARELLAARSTFARVREVAEREEAAPTGMPDLSAVTTTREDEALWKELGELGWTGIAVPEEHGGQGLGVIELAAITEELGYAVAPVPFLGSVAAALVVQHEGSEEQREDWLPHLAAGGLRGAVTLTGDRAPVPGAAEGGLTVVADAAANGPAALYGPGSGVVEEVDAIDPTRGHGRVAIDALDPEGELDGRGEWLGGTPTATGPGLDRATIVVAAELVGVAQRALDMTVAYVKERRQFGVPVGSFQAVQHGAAQMLRDVTMARSLTYHAAWMADAGDPAQLPVAAAMAKAAASDAGRAVTAAAVQLHGGIGFTWEADVHWLLKRAQVDAALLGGGGHHRRRVAAAQAAGGSGSGSGA